MKTLPMVISTGRSPLRCGFFILPIAIGWFALSSAIEAGCPSVGGCAGANTAVGDNALLNVTSGVWNVGVGFQALLNETTGNQNTAIGFQALLSNVSGNHSTAIGGLALSDNTTGNDNVGVGFQTLSQNTTGNRNTGMGYRTLAFNLTGSDNTAVGWNALYNNRDDAEDNTGVGSQALYHNTAGEFNVAVGDSALFSFNGTTGTGANTALGSIALNAETTGQRNVGAGRRALEFLLTGSDNTAVGWRAGDNYIGGESGNIVIGSFVTGVTGENNVTRVGNIGNTAQASGVFVTVESVGGTKLGYVVSSRRYKEDIKPMDKASESLFALTPVTFRYKKDMDPAGTQQYGLIAEDVAKVSPDLVVNDKEGKPATLHFLNIQAMMLNEFLKEHRTVQELKSTLAKQEATIAQLKNDLQVTAAQQQEEVKALTAQLKGQAAQIQKVSAQVEMSKPAPEVVAGTR